MAKKILYIGNFQTLSVGEPEIAASLEEQGYEVTRVSEADTSVAEVLRIAKENTFEFVLFAKLRVGIPAAVFDLYKEIDVPKVCWVFDLYWGL